MSNARVMYDLMKMISPSPIQASYHETTSETLTRLKFIGTLEAGEKLDVRNLKIESNTIITPFKRMFFGESREATYSFIITTIERSFAILYSMAATEKVSDTMLCSNILLDMNKAMNGLVNLQTTYRDDKMFVCNIEMLIQTIQAKMVEVQHKYPEIWKLFVTTQQEKSSPLLTAMQSSQTVPAIIEETKVEEKEKDKKKK